MSRKQFLPTYTLLDAQSLASNFNSNSTNIKHIDNIGYQIVTSSITDNTGQFSIQVSNDDSTFEDITVTPTISALANADVSIFIGLNQLPFPYVRLKFVAAGSVPDGSVTVKVAGKAV